MLELDSRHHLVRTLGALHDFKPITKSQIRIEARSEARSQWVYKDTHRYNGRQSGNLRHCGTMQITDESEN